MLPLRKGLLEESRKDIGGREMCVSLQFGKLEDCISELLLDITDTACC